MIKVVIFDLDQTLVDSSCAEQDRKNREWSKVYSKIPTMRCYDGIHDILRYLVEKKIIIVILTSSPRVYCEKVLQYFNIKPDFIVAYHDVKLHKPNPESINLVIEKFNIQNPKSVLHIGDDPKDTFASKAAGVISGGALWGNRDNSELLKSYPDLLFGKPSDIAQKISIL